MDLRLRFRKTRGYVNAVLFIVLIVSISLLSACSDGSTEKENSNITEPSLPLQAYTGAFLYDNIPAPTTADVYVLTNITDGQHEIYSFTLENFTLQEAKDYIEILKSSVIEKQEKYDVYTENDYPILNYFGWLNNGNAVSISQCDNGGGITISVAKSKVNTSE